VLFAAHVGPVTTNVNRGANAELGRKAWPIFLRIERAAANIARVGPAPSSGWALQKRLFCDVHHIWVGVINV
jgi:hypothetical protein